MEINVEDQVAAAPGGVQIAAGEGVGGPVESEGQEVRSRVYAEISRAICLLAHKKTYLKLYLYHKVLF